MKKEKRKTVRNKEKIITLVSIEKHLPALLGGSSVFVIWITLNSLITAAV